MYRIFIDSAYIEKAASDSVNAGNPTHAPTSETANQTTASADTIPQSGEPVKGENVSDSDTDTPSVGSADSSSITAQQGSQERIKPNLEEIRGRDVDAMTVNGLEYSVTATVNGYTARIGDGDI